MGYRNSPLTRKRSISKEQALAEVQLAAQSKVSSKQTKSSKRRILKRRSSRELASRLFSFRLPGQKSQRQQQSQMPLPRKPGLGRRRSSARTRSMLAPLKFEGSHLRAGREFLHSTCTDDEIVSPRPQPGGAANRMPSPRTHTKVLNKMMTYLKLGRCRCKRQWADLIMAILSVASFGLAVQAESHLWLNSNVPDEHVDSAKSLISLLCLALASGVVYKTHLSVTEDRLLNRILPEVTLWTSGRLSGMFCEVAFNLLHAPSGMHRDYTYRIGDIDIQVFAYYTLDAFGCIVHCFKLYHILPLILNYLKVDSTSGQVYGAANGVTLGMTFTAKAWLHSHPLAFITISSLFLNASLTYICWLCERAYCAPWAKQWSNSAEIASRCSPDELERVYDFGDSFWYMFNMLSGLGNATAPLTTLGRVVATIAMVIGLVLLALILNAVTETMEMTTSENATHIIMRRSRHRIRLYAAAAELIEATYLRHRAKLDMLVTLQSQGRAKTASKAAAALLNTAEFMVTGMQQFKTGAANSAFCQALDRFVKERWEGTKISALTEAQIMARDVQHVIESRLNQISTDAAPKFERLEKAVYRLTEQAIEHRDKWPAHLKLQRQEMGHGDTPIQQSRKLFLAKVSANQVESDRRAKAFQKAMLRATKNGFENAGVLNADTSRYKMAANPPVVVN